VEPAVVARSPHAIQGSSARRGYSEMLRQGAIVFAGSMSLAACGFIFQMIASRRLGVEEYGTFYALLSVVMVAGLPGAVLSPVVARYAAEFRALHDDAHVNGLMLDVTRWTTIAALSYIVIGFIMAVPLGNYLRVPAWTIPVASVIASVWLASTILRAVAQGTQDFASLSTSNAAEGVAKVIALAALLLLGFGLRGGLLGVAAGAVVGLVIVAWTLSRRYAATERCRVRYDWRRIGRCAAAAASMTLATTLIGSVDVVLVKHYFSGYEAGLYAAAALGGKVLFFAVGFVSMVLLPRVTEHHVRGERTRDVLALGIGALIVAALSGGIMLRLFGSDFLHLLVGPAFASGLPLLLPYAASMMVLSVTNVFGSYGIARHRTGFSVPLGIGVGSTLALIAVWHPNVDSVVRILLIGNGMTCCAVLIAIMAQAKVPSTVTDSLLQSG
jgi:O-antigen/teichoic acid export membrane protein